MPRKLLRKFLPTSEEIHRNRYVGRFGGLLRHPNLWHLNRHSVSGGVAVGLFSGLVPGPFQMLTALALAIPLRVNLPVALATTLYTNPFTIVPLYIAAFYIGSLLTGAPLGAMVEPPAFAWSDLAQSVAALAHWAISLGKPLAVGLVALALSLAALGWIGVQVAWRAWVVVQWRRRRLRRAKPGSRGL
ncbi:MAG: DUF2062 domain-containing protein [Burkholderiales bacterium]|nr:DUF2062 domain-containing protein [Burkholderiales bacterium]